MIWWRRLAVWLWLAVVLWAGLATVCAGRWERKAAKLEAEKRRAADTKEIENGGGIVEQPDAKPKPPETIIKVVERVVERTGGRVSGAAELNTGPVVIAPKLTTPETPAGCPVTADTGQPDLSQCACAGDTVETKVELAEVTAPSGAAGLFGTVTVTRTKPPPPFVLVDAAPFDPGLSWARFQPPENLKQPARWMAGPAGGWCGDGWCVGGQVASPAVNIFGLDARASATVLAGPGDGVVVGSFLFGF